MPEGPEVRCIAIKLNQYCQGQIIKAIKWDDKSKYRTGISNYSEFVKYLPGKIKGITCKGKQLIFIIQPHQFNESKELIYIKSTLGLEGRWSFGDMENKHANLWLELEKYNLYYIDSRHFGNITLFTSMTDLLDDLNDKVGPDLLAYAIEVYSGMEIVEEEEEKITIDRWMERLKDKRLKNKQICQFLMEQKYFSGIGNYLKAEILYHAKIRPDRLLSQLTDKEITQLYHSTLTIIYQAFCAGGLTIKSYWQPTGPDDIKGASGERGKYKKIIYNCEKDPEGNPIIQQKFKDGRTTHWVPAIQS